MCYMIVSSKTVHISNFQTLSKLMTSQFKINLVTLLIHHYLDILCFGFLCVRHVFRVYCDQTMKTNFQRDNKLSVYLDPHLENWSGCLFHTLVCTVLFEVCRLSSNGLGLTTSSSCLWPLTAVASNPHSHKHYKWVSETRDNLDLKKTRQNKKKMTLPLKNCRHIDKPGIN